MDDIGRRLFISAAATAGKLQASKSSLAKEEAAPARKGVVHAPKLSSFIRRNFKIYPKKFSFHSTRTITSAQSNALNSISVHLAAARFEKAWASKSTD